MPAFQVVSALLVSLFFCFPSRSFAAEANFYSMHEEWAKHSKAGGKGEAVEREFSQAFSSRGFAPSAAPAPILLHRTLQEALGAGGPTEVELGQTLHLDGIGSLVKFVATDEGIVTLENVDTGTLRIVGSSIGETFVHVWNKTGRSTLALRVTRPKHRINVRQLREREAIEKNRPFQIHYSNSRSADYNGSKFREMPRSNLDFNQSLSMDGDTPYGALSSHVQTQKARGKTLLSDAQVALRDGHVGPARNFNAVAGDVRVEPSFIVFPSARIRGGSIEHWNDSKQTQGSVFHGREDVSLYGALTSGLQTKRTLNSDLSGAVLDTRLNDNAKVRAGAFSGSGRSRPDELNKSGYGAQSELKFGEHITMENEADFDNEKFANKHAFTMRFEKLRVRNEFRDISKKFFTLVGAPSRQGEVGYLVDVSATPLPKWAMTGTFDIFRDRLVPNPEDPSRMNTHLDLGLNYTPCDEVSYGLTFQDLDDTGRIGPTRFRNVGFQYNERFDMWGRKATLFSRYNYRENHFLTNSLGDFRQNQAVLGLYTALFWGLNFSVQKEWNALEDIEVGRYTHPSALVYTLDTNRQIGQTPFFAEARARLRDEEQTESPNSFMLGEDSYEFSGGLFYREYEDLELFLTGSFTQYLPEGSDVTDSRVEAQFYTGMRCNFDTGVRWSASGDFEGLVFKDKNGDGERQEDEAGLAGLTVVASDDQSAVTDSEGRYSLKKVSGKQVSLSLDSSKIPYGFVPTGDVVRQFAITQGKTQRADFGLTPRSDLTGIVFDDLNGNGRFDSGEPAIQNVLLTLEDGRATRTSGSGVYTFVDLLTGPHTVTLSVQKLPEGYLPAGSPKKDFTLSEGVRYETNFPLRGQRAVTGRVFWDQDGDSMLGEKDMPLSGVTVRLGMLNVETDQEGWYLFNDLAPGTYTLSAEGFQRTLELSLEPKTLTDIDIPLERG